LKPQTNRKPLVYRTGEGGGWLESADGAHHAAEPVEELVIMTFNVWMEHKYEAQRWASIVDVIHKSVHPTYPAPSPAVPSVTPSVTHSLAYSFAPHALLGPPFSHGLAVPGLCLGRSRGVMCRVSCLGACIGPHAVPLAWASPLAPLIRACLGQYLAAWRWHVSWPAPKARPTQALVKGRNSQFLPHLVCPWAHPHTHTSETTHT
jgi:hypothetical protein